MHSEAKTFPIVCVGGSAGSLKAYTDFLQSVPARFGIALVMVNHARSASQLPKVLARHTTMLVEYATEEMLIEPDRVYVIPPDRDLHVRDGKFRLAPTSKPSG